MEKPNLPENMPLTPKRLEDLARMFMMRNYPGDPIKVSLSEKEDAELNHFLETAAQHQIDAVKERAIWQRKYFNYTDKSSPEEEKDKIKEEMKRDSNLMEYIEGTQAYALAEDYVIWKYGVENSKKQTFEMSDEDIFTFFNLIEEYPAQIDQSLGFMTSKMQPGLHRNS